jgi:hypothetical protein
MSGDRVIFNTIVRPTWACVAAARLVHSITRAAFDQSLMRDAATSVNFEAFDPRKDGAALPRPMSGSDDACATAGASFFLEWSA